MKTATATFTILGVIIGAAVLVLAFLYLQQKQAYEDLEERTFALEGALAAQLQPGPTGPTGPTGPQGPSGARGPAGPEGDVGTLRFDVDDLTSDVDSLRSDVDSLLDCVSDLETAVEDLHSSLDSLSFEINFARPTDTLSDLFWFGPSSLPRFFC